jgi:N-acetylneuraminate synthase
MMAFGIAGRPIGPEHPPYIVAELSGNHNGDIRKAFELIEIAKAAGADAVKIQTYTADTITIDHDGPEFIIRGGPWDQRRLYELYSEAHTPWEWHHELFAKARALGITMFSSPFDPTAIDFLESLGAPAYKIASFEAIDLPLIAKAASTGKPLIISTGMANQQEISEAITTVHDSGNDALVLLHCISAYPAKPEEANLRTIGDMADRFGVIAGLSDHTLGIEVAIAGVAAGASVIEKHVTLRRADGGPDASFSLEPGELKQLCEGCRTAWLAMGKAHYERTQGERGNIVFRRSLYVVQDVLAGQEFSLSNVRSIRPGYGLPPKCLPQILGRRALRAVKRGTPVDWSMVRGEPDGR